jgi:hypothetical protein
MNIEKKNLLTQDAEFTLGITKKSFKKATASAEKHDN